MRCRSCGKVKRERLDFLADNPLYTKRFAHYVGERCRQATIKDIAEELKLDWDNRISSAAHSTTRCGNASRNATRSSLATIDRPPSPIPRGGIIG